MTLDLDELLRLQTLFEYEERAISQGFSLIAGIDEAGRGPLAGPVVAGACILPKGLIFQNINDSKKLTSLQRESLYQEITSRADIIFGIGIVDHKEIDKVNIHQAGLKAMKKAIKALSAVPDLMLVDGMHLPFKKIPYWRIVGGDEVSVSIMSAAILAKVTRDRIMVEYHKKWPKYGFDKHKGYGTEEHLKALKQFGPCPIHRKSFAPVRGCLETILNN